jgi:hypothetical protein
MRTYNNTPLQDFGLISEISAVIVTDCDTGERYPAVRFIVGNDEVTVRSLSSARASYEELRSASMSVYISVDSYRPYFILYLDARLVSLQASGLPNIDDYV